QTVPATVYRQLRRFQRWSLVSSETGKAVKQRAGSQETLPAATEATTYAPGKGKWRQKQQRSWARRIFDERQLTVETTSSLDALDLPTGDRGRFSLVGAGGQTES